MRRNRTINWLPSLAVGGLVLALSALSVQAQQGRTDPAGQAGQLGRKDYKFVVEAAHINLGEVRLGGLAQTKGASQAVRSFGEHMINDHSKAEAGLKEIASQKGAVLPADLSHKQDALLGHLQSLSGAAFDKAYAQDMVKGHTQAVKAFERASKKLSDVDLRAWAQSVLPLLQEHLRLAKSMDATVNAAP